MKKCVMTSKCVIASEGPLSMIALFRYEVVAMVDLQNSMQNNVSVLLKYSHVTMRSETP